MSKDDYPRDALKPGHLLLWYKIEKVLGEGGFGITYLAHDVNLDKKVAIKEYLPGEMCRRNDDNTISPSTNSVEDFESGLNRFIREARTLAKFEHPHIVKVSNVFEENNTAYMAMAYEKGKDLKTLISPRKSLDQDHLLSIILPILEGLEYVHDTGFIHRDIKPGNIMIREDGTPVLIDFGSVHNTKKEQAAVTTLVSPGFTPHEQYVGKPELQGPWSDIYSLGATLYRCVCGRNPVDALTRGSALIKQEDDPLPSVTKVTQGEYNTCLLNAIDHALSFDEKKRPQTVGAWRDELVGDCPDAKTKANTGLLSSITRTQTRQSDTTIDLTHTVQPQVTQKNRYQYVVMACIALLLVSIGITFFNEGEQKETTPAVATVSSNKAETIAAVPKPLEEIKTEAFAESAVTDTTDNDATVFKEITDKLSDGTAGPTLVIIPKGSNTIGSDIDEEGHRADEEPKRLITLKNSIAIGKTEVTIADFRKFTEATGYLTAAEQDKTHGCRTFQQGWDWRPGISWRNPGYSQQEDHPVVCVSWQDAMAYVKWLSEETGKSYQLPSEAVWEYATRAGTTSTRFWGDERACDYSNVSDFSRASEHNLNISTNNIFSCEDGNAYSASVASFKPNQFGLHDTIGNVWEWTVDCWNENYSNINEDGSPRLDGNCDNRIYRGGSWGNLPVLVRAAKRLTDPVHYRYYNLGFRISRSIDS